MQCDVIYTPSEGKSLPRLARAGVLLTQRVGAERENRKALAILSAETFMPAVGINYDTGWLYDATELVNGRWLHHFFQGTNDTPTSHVWIDASQSIDN
jgi:hypothetical protein